MAINFFKSLLQDYHNKLIREEKRYLFDESNQFVLFSGTALGQTGDIRHLNDLYFIIFLLRYNKIDASQITLAIDMDILEEFRVNIQYQEIAKVIEQNVQNIIDINDFVTTYQRDPKKDLIFIASGHGNINGLSNGKNHTFITSDYFEDNATFQSRTIMIMTQCYAGAFHHLDTRKNICVLGASEYQESLSLPITRLLKDDLHGKDLQDFIQASLIFNPNIPINPFLFSLFTILIDINQMQTKKHLINVYKRATTFTLQYLKRTEHTLGVSSIGADPQGITQITFDSSKLIQQPYLLNKIIAARLYMSK